MRKQTSTTKKELYTTIHVERAKRRMTQKELAERVGVARPTIIKLEKNKIAPSLILAHNIANVFGLPIEKVFYYGDLPYGHEQKNE